LCTKVLPTFQLLTQALLAIPFFIVLWVALAVVVAAWIYLVGGEPPNNPLEPTVQAGNWPVAVVFTLVAAIVAPITEEVFFRGMVYNCLCQRMHFKLSIILQGAVFGWLHTFGYVHAAMASLLGMALAALYEWRRTLLTPIFVHAFQNALVGSIAVMAAINTANAPVLGIQGDPHDEGCLVTKVFPDTGADEAGLRADDVITSIDGEPVVNIQDVSNAVRKKRAGDLVEFTFLRGGKLHRAEVVLRRRRQ
jgi:membrane protease YdiL (CAAX protease family)